jgi:hypothetical protein
MEPRIRKDDGLRGLKVCNSNNYALSPPSEDPNKAAQTLPPSLETVFAKEDLPCAHF